MKTYLTYGAGLALAVFLLQLVFFILGFHSDVDKYNASLWFATVANIAVAVAAIALGIRARRAASDPAAAFSYGNAFGAGFGVTVVSAVGGAATNLLYMTVINPHLVDIMVQAQMDKLSAKGMSGDQLDQAEKFTRMFLGPIVGPLMYILFGLFFGTLITLIVAAFLKRPAPSQVASA